MSFRTLFDALARPDPVRLAYVPLGPTHHTLDPVRMRTTLRRGGRSVSCEERTRPPTRPSTTPAGVWGSLRVHVSATHRPCRVGNVPQVPFLPTTGVRVAVPGCCRPCPGPPWRGGTPTRFGWSLRNQGKSRPFRRGWRVEPRREEEEGRVGTTGLCSPADGADSRRKVEEVKTSRDGDIGGRGTGKTDKETQIREGRKRPRRKKGKDKGQEGTGHRRKRGPTEGAVKERRRRTTSQGRKSKYGGQKDEPRKGQENGKTGG